MEDTIRRRTSYFIIVYSGLLLTVTRPHCSKPALSENTQVVPQHSMVNLTCPGCHGQTWWSRNSRTMRLQSGPHLFLESVGYEDEDNYTCYRDGAPVCTLQLLVKDDIEKPQIWCYIRNPTHNITCDWLTRELRPHTRVTLIAWKLDGNHNENTCSYVPSAGKFTCSTPYREGDTERHILSLCVVGRTDHQVSNKVDSTAESLVQPDPPINVSVTQEKDHPRRLIVSWLPPQSWLNYLYHLVYQVQYSVGGSQYVSNGTTFEQNFIINDALARRRHEVRVRAKEEFYLTWSAWSQVAVGTPWSEDEDDQPAFMDDFNITLVEPQDPGDEVEDVSAPVPLYVWLLAGGAVVIVLLLLLGMKLRYKDLKLLKLKGGVLRSLFQPARGAPAGPHPLSGDPLLPVPGALSISVPYAAE